MRGAGLVIILMWLIFIMLLVAQAVGVHIAGAIEGIIQ